MQRVRAEADQSSREVCARDATALYPTGTFPCLLSISRTVVSHVQATEWRTYGSALNDVLAPLSQQMANSLTNFDGYNNQATPISDSFGLGSAPAAGESILLVLIGRLSLHRCPCQDHAGFAFATAVHVLYFVCRMDGL